MLKMLKNYKPSPNARPKLPPPLRPFNAFNAGLKAAGLGTPGKPANPGEKEPLLRYN